MAIWRAVAGPGVQIIPIQCSSISAAGAIHRIAEQAPRYVVPMPSAAILAPIAGSRGIEGTTETIRRNATDADNFTRASADLTHSLDDDGTWTPTASGLPDPSADPGAATAEASEPARLQVVASPPTAQRSRG
ncbi:MAG TPA: hypothetical protein PKC43_12550 [Phycisphaerales bacterium]|nr:hypothetical protein [Phycisphaerales bacterium]HMP38262.1 hypothetical protein [Phycisphaerales bacterium]